MVEGNVIFCVDSQIVHVDFKPFSLSMSMKMWFMNAWNVGGVLQNPKNMSVGSKSPMRVVNVAFH